MKTNQTLWTVCVENVNAIIKARGMTLRAAAGELGFGDESQFHRWVRATEAHEPKANVALRFAAWVEQHKSFLPSGGASRRK